jgi:hypothetical protein
VSHVAGENVSRNKMKLKNDKNYNPEVQLVSTVFGGTGYHSRLKAGTTVHDTRLSANYALECLREGGQEYVKRATDIFDKLCSLQDVDPVSSTYGIWSWTYEETLEQMQPPDWNWADFIGARIAHALKLYPRLLPEDTVGRLREALAHAAWSIFRRNVAADYTNIAIMGAVVTAAAGELLDLSMFLKYARRRLASVLDSVKANGSFSEYNSPTYTVVVIEELDRLSLLVSDPECNSIGDKLWFHAWEIVAEHFHPPTLQWAGPHARSYSDLLRPNTQHWLTAATGIVFPDQEKEENDLIVKPRPCPPELQPRFRKLPESEFTVVRQFAIGKTGPVTGTTWMSEKSCLASINRACTWVQRRFLVGYLKIPAGVAVLKLSVLLNGLEFPGFRVFQQQTGSRVLSAFQPLFGTGYYHPTLDAISDGIIDCEDLRFRYTLLSRDVRTDSLSDGRFSLSTEGFHAVITPAVSAFNGIPVNWKPVEIDGGVAVDAIVYCGSRKQINMAEATMRIATGLELVSNQDKALPVPVSMEPVSGNKILAEWGSLSVEVPTESERFTW